MIFIRRTCVRCVGRPPCASPPFCAPSASSSYGMPVTPPLLLFFSFVGISGYVHTCDCRGAAATLPLPVCACVCFMDSYPSTCALGIKTRRALSVASLSSPRPRWWRTHSGDAPHDAGGGGEKAECSRSRCRLLRLVTNYMRACRLCVACRVSSCPKGTRIRSWTWQPTDEQQL